MRRLLLWYWRHQLPYDRRLAAHALNARLPNTDSGRKSTALLSAPPATARCGGWRRIMPGRWRECGCQLSGLHSPARAPSRFPFRLAAPLNRETAEALSAWPVRNRGRWFTAATAPAASRWAVYRPGLALAHYGSNDVPSPTVFADTLDRCFSACSEMLTRHCAKRCLTPIRRSWTIWPGAAGDCRV